MNRLKAAVLIAVMTSVAVGTGCAVRLGGPAPEEYDTVAAEFPGNTSVEDAATRLRELSAELALIATPNDSNWVRQLASTMQLTSTDPGRVGGLTLAFATPLKIVGDTTLRLEVQGGGRLEMHDALFEIDKNRHLDLMTVIFEPNTPARAGVTRLLNYIATDVGSTAVVALAIKAPNGAIADSIADITRAAWGDAWECTEAGKRNERAPAGEWRLFHFPAARVRCATANTLGSLKGYHARLVVGG
jgi:hypothetical protein